MAGGMLTDVTEAPIGVLRSALRTAAEPTTGMQRYDSDAQGAAAAPRITDPVGTSFTQ